MKKEMIQTRNRKMNKKMIMKHEIMEDDWTNNDDWLKSYTLNRAASDILEIEHDEGIEATMDSKDEDNIDVGGGVEDVSIEDDAPGDDNVFDQSSYSMPPTDDNIALPSLS